MFAIDAKQQGHAGIAIGGNGIDARGAIEEFALNGWIDREIAVVPIVHENRAAIDEAEA